MTHTDPWDDPAYSWCQFGRNLLAILVLGFLAPLVKLENR